MDTLPGCRLSPPRGKPARYAICLFTTKVDEGVHIGKLEYFKPDQVGNAIACMRKLRKLRKRIDTGSTETLARSRSLH